MQQGKSSAHRAWRLALGGIVAASMAVLGSIGGCANGQTAVDLSGDDSGGGTVSGGDASCASDQTACGDQCVDVTTSGDHCGSCGNACTGSQVCSQGKCSTSCSGSAIKCGNSCVNGQTDPNNCGTCGNACASGQGCTNGTCDVACALPQKKCTGACTNTDTDRKNCGSCGNACQSGYDCVAGQCALACDAGTKACGPDGGVPVCVDTSNNVANCGACNSACPTSDGGTYACTNGACVLGCVAPQSRCGSGVNQFCANLLTDPANCGTCGNACPQGQTCSAGQCAVAASCAVNLARSGATASMSSGGVTTYGPQNMNDGVAKTSCNAFAWVTNSTSPSGAYVQLTWGAAQTIQSFYLETEPSTCSEPAGRNVHSGTVQWWNGSSWVTATTFSFPANHGDVQVNLPSPVSTTQLRIFDLTTDPGNGNSIIYEWHVYSAINCMPPP